MKQSHARATRLLATVTALSLMALAVLPAMKPATARPHHTNRHRAIVVIPADAGALKAAIAALKGHVVVVNFWATWCEPCVAEFPALVKLQRRYRKAGLVVVAVSGDMLKDRDTKVKPFLKKKRAYFTNFLMQYKDPDEFISSFDPKWHGEFPRTLIYDKEGHLVKALSDEQTLKSFEAAVKPLLKQP